MSARLYVGNLPYSTTDDQLREAFAAHGEIVSATVVVDRDSGRSRGFGFVEFGSEAEARTAAGAMNGYMMDGRALTVNPARARTEGPRGGGGAGGGPGGGSGGGGRHGRGGGGRDRDRSGRPPRR